MQRECRNFDVATWSISALLSVLDADIELLCIHTLPLTGLHRLVHDELRAMSEPDAAAQGVTQGERSRRRIVYFITAEQLYVFL